MKRWQAALWGVLGMAGSAQGALQPPVNGQVYDDVLGISWLQDANFVKTSCDANNALWQAFDPTAIANNSGRSKAQICTANGLLNWYEAEGWIAVLNANNHLGVNTWRQPSTGPVDGSAFDYGFSSDGSTDWGYNISAPLAGSAFPGSTGSELAYMHYNNLGNQGWVNTDGSSSNVDPAAGWFCSNVDPWCLQNTAPFQNLQSNWYWSGTEYAPGPSHAWYFNAYNGSQYDFDKAFGDGFVWPVRPRQAAVPSAIPTLSVWGLGLMGLLLAGLARRRLR